MNVQVYWSHSFLPELIRPDGLVFDFGVNDGGFSRVVASRCRAVIGFEPDPAWRDRLTLPANVRVIAKALAAHAGPHAFHVSADQCSSMHFAGTASTTVEVEAITLGEALAQESGRIDLVKMDIEGEEVAVLLDAPADLFTRVVQMTVEFHDFLNPEQLPDIRRAIARMADIGFDAVCFSFRSYGDVLFINRQLAPLSPIQRAWMIARFKYLRGAARVAGRLVGA